MSQKVSFDIDNLFLVFLRGQAGAIAAIFSTLILYPLENLQTRM